MKNKIILERGVIVAGLITITALAQAQTNAPILLSEGFEGATYDPRISVSTRGTFTTPPGVENRAVLGSPRAFGFGKTTCPANCFWDNVTFMTITFPGGANVSQISFKSIEMDGDWGSSGVVFTNVNPTSLPRGFWDLTIGGVSIEAGLFDSPAGPNTFVVPINGMVTNIVLAVADITGVSEIYVDDIVVIGTPSKQALAITSSPVGQTDLAGGTAQLKVLASGISPLYYQWTLNGTNLTDTGRISGSESNLLTITHLNAGDAGAYSVTVSNVAGVVVSQPAILTIQETPHSATATATVVNGFVVGATILDTGWAYTNTPPVRIIGGAGSGAQATAVVSNGVVVEVDVSNPGQGYTSDPAVVIAPPFISQPVIGISPLSLLSFAGLQAGTNYQLQAIVEGVHTSLGDQFTATNSMYTRLFPGTVSASSYVFAPVPFPQQATATGQVINGFLIGVTLARGGSGYTTNPAVTVYGAGTGAALSAFVDPATGTVTNIVLDSPGSGYVNGLVIAIAPPPTAFVWPSSVTQVMRLDFDNLSPYDNYQIEFAPVAGGAWNSLGAPFMPTATSNTQDVNVSGAAGLFRAHYLGH